MNNNNLSPLCFLPSGKLICYRYGSIIVLHDEKIERELQIFTTKKETVLGRSRLAYRLMRLGIRTAIALNEDEILLSIGNLIYELDLKKGKLSNGFFCGEGVRPLSFTLVNEVDCIENGIYFGSYQSVNSKNPVRIFKRIRPDEWKVVYTFELGSVEHVHTIVPDTYRKCVWVFTGDFGDSSAIWKVTEKFNKLERLFYGSQKYRSCVAYALPEGLLYATDSPLDDDYIYLLNPETGELKEIMPISGSCIYGCRWKDDYVFESTVEPSGIYKNMLEELFCREIGPGIKDRFVRIYCGNLKTGFEEIYKEKKDSLPYATFQFGAIRFPTGINDDNRLWFQPIATKKDDLKLLNYRSK